MKEETSEKPQTEQVTSQTMAGMIHSNNIKFFEDDGHGWLRVPLTLIQYLGINKQISEYSYDDKKYAYLEEDLDLTIFFNAIGIGKGSTILRALFWDNCLTAYHSGESPIRRYPHYDSIKMESIFSQHSLNLWDGLNQNISE